MFSNFCFRINITRDCTRTPSSGSRICAQNLTDGHLPLDSASILYQKYIH